MAVKRGRARAKGPIRHTKAPTSSYAVRKKGPGGRTILKYPINTRRRAANALARVKQFGTASERSDVYGAVARKYPRMARTSSVPAVRRKAKGGTTRKRTTGRKRTRR